MVGHSATELIERKRDRGELSDDELRWVITSYTADALPDYQMAALLMAIFLNGMSPRELATWTDAMLHSGEVLDLSDVPLPKVDKHSTGGVGDKISIPLAPMVAACGVAVPMMSGRGLGHTGGTLDKLDSIPGFRSALEPARFRAVLAEHGLVLAGQSETLVPADRRIYALRDATGTVPSVPLISSSIMSKKLAEGLDALVLDVKVGSGAFMKDAASARELAETMVGIGAAHGTRVTALLTDMSQPLGREVGNASEIAESLDVLEGRGPADVTELTLRLGAEMLVGGGAAADETEARDRLEGAVSSGKALELLAAVIDAQGGDAGVITDRTLLGAAAHRDPVPSPAAGYVTRCDALDIGAACVRLGGGRQRKEDDIDHTVGITVLKKVGDPVTAGEPLAFVAYNHSGQLDAARDRLTAAWEVGEAPPPLPDLILDRVDP